MNHCYRLVFNASLGTWVAAPDFARGAGKAAVRRRGAGAAWVKALLALAAAFPVQAQQWSAGTGDWFNAGNWSAGVPTSTSLVNVVNGGTAQVQAAGAAAERIFVYGGSTLEVTGAGRLSAAAGIVAGESTSGTVRATGGGQLTGRNLHLDSAAEALLLVDGAGSRVSVDSILIGNTRNGTTILSNGGALQAGRVSMGYVGGTGTLHIGDGSGAGIVDAPVVETGSTGAGTINFNHTDPNYFFTRDGTGTGGAIAIAGNINVNAIGGGTTTLTGNNTYSGGTSIGTGTTLRVGNGGTIGTIGAGAITNDGTLVVRRADRFTLGQDISGTGRVAQAGTGTLVLTGTNTYSGTTSIAAGGTLKIGDGGATGSLGTGAVSNDGDLVFDRNDNIIVGNDISGTGDLTQQGAGKVTLTNNNSYTGTTTISAGRLQVGNGGMTGSLGTGAVINNAELIFARSDNFTVSNAISGTGSLVHQGNGRMTLTGSNSYTGTTTIATGTLQVGNGGTAGTLGSGDVINNGELVFNRTDAVTVANDISGSGSLTQSGANGVLELLGSNTYTGSTYITAGGEIRIAAGALGGELVEFNGGRLRALETMTLDQELVFFGGTNGLAASDGQVLTVAGRTDISGGTVLRLGGTGAMGAIRLEGKVDHYSGTLDFNGVTTFISDIWSGDTLTSSGALADVTIDMGEIHGPVTGNLALTVADDGWLALSGSNSYLGATTVGEGATLRLGNAGALPTGTTVTVRASGSLDLDGYDQTIGSLASEGEWASVYLNDATLTVGGNGASTTYAGWIGSGALVKTGAGNLTLTGDFNYLTATRIAAGTLTVGDGGNTGTLGPGDVVNDATLAFNRGDDVVVDTTITGTGMVRKLGAGTLELTGNNGYSGGTSVEAGTLSISADHNLGAASGTLFLNGGTLRTTATIDMTRAVTLSDNGTFDLDGSLTLNGAVGGSGNLVVEGNGALFLQADSNYTGTTTISSDSTIVVGLNQSTGSLGTGAVTNHGMLSFFRNGDFTVPNAISGTGQLRHYGDGTMVLTGDNSYTGMTTIADGTLQVGNGGTTGSLGSGDIANYGSLVFNRSDTVSVANRIGELGSLTQAGSGHLVLTAASFYTGGTFVNAGKLSVNGSIIGDTTVNNGGTLGGTGRVGNVTVASGGTLAPGNSIGTLSVDGNLRFAPGSIYRVEANAAGAADRVNTLGAGTITINGGTVDVQAGGGGYQRNTRYTILSSGGATTGRFANATTNLAFLTPTLIYEGNAVLLNLQAGDAPEYASAARTFNQRAVANYLQSFANTPSNATAAGLIQQIDNMTADQASASFESMAGSAHASASQVASALGRNFSATLAARSGFGAGGLGNAMNDLSQVRYASLAPVHAPQDSTQSGGLWVQAVGAGGRLDADGNAAGSRYGSSGFVLGYDQPVTGRWTAGGAFGYSTSHWNSTSGDDASGKIESPQAGVYARYDGERVRVRIDGTVSRHDFTTDRTIEIAGAGAVANSKHDGHEWGLGAQVEMPIQAGSWELRPLAGIRHAHLKEDSFSETGPSPANLAVASRTTQNTLLSAGMHFVRPFQQGKGGVELRAVASHLAGDNDSPVTASIAGQPGSFTASGVPLKRNALALGATVSGEVARNVNAYLDANYETRGSGQEAWRVTAGVRVSF